MVSFSGDGFVPPLNQKLVAAIDDRVEVTCSVQDNAFVNEDTVIEWRDEQVRIRSVGGTQYTYTSIRPACRFSNFVQFSIPITFVLIAG